MIGSEGFWTGRIMKMFNTQWSAIDYGHCLVKERFISRGVKSACRVVEHGSQDTSDWECQIRTDSNPYDSLMGH